MKVAELAREQATAMNLKICNQAHVCKKEPCTHKVPHEGQCANAMPCHDFQWNAGTSPDKCTIPISACVPVVDGKYHTWLLKLCPHCLGIGRIEEKVYHSV